MIDPTSRAKIIVYCKLLLTALFWGGSWVAGRAAVQELAPLTIASWRFFLAALVMGAILLRREGWPSWNLRQWLLIISLGASGVFLYNIFFLYGLQVVDAGRGALVTALSPVCIALADKIIFRTSLPNNKKIGVSLALGGCLLVITHGHPTRLFAGEIGHGELLLLACMLCWVFYTLIVRRAMRQLSTLALTFGGCLTGWLMLSALAIGEGSLFAFDHLSWKGTSAVIFLGLFGTAIAFLWYSEGIARIGATTTAAYINLVPVFAILLGIVLLGEKPDSSLLLGAILVVSGIILTNRSPTKRHTSSAKA